MRSVFLHIIASLMHMVVSEKILHKDILEPYKDYTARRRSHRSVRECQPARYNNVTFELYKSHFTSDRNSPVYTGFQFNQEVGTYWKQEVLGNFLTINNPFQTVSVLDPGKPGGCHTNSTATVQHTAELSNCIAAMNGGMFNVTSFQCLGNLVVDGKVIQNNRGIQNAHFGIKKDSSIFVGYIPEGANLDQYSQLIGGVIWLVRDGKNYVAESIKAECAETQTTSSLQGFADVISARSAIGHNAAGQVIMAEVDGKTWKRGINLHDFADLLILYGVVNAINLDGGGSATLVINDTLVSHPSDTVTDTKTNISYSHAREVSTVVCVHDYECDPKDCNNHGDCRHGKCYCHGNWAGPACAHIQCGFLNCSGHGVCTQGGCKCSPGWNGTDCNEPCYNDTYGTDCTQSCQCSNDAECDPVDGSCRCKPGYTGLLCDQECPYGYFGKGCRQICYCKHSCFCHHITGDCHVSYKASNFWIASKCLAESFIAERNLVPENLEQYRLWLITTILLATIAAASIILNISFVCTNCTCDMDTPDIFNKRRRQIYTNNSGYVRARKTYTTTNMGHGNMLISSYSSLSSSLCSDADNEKSEELDTTSTTPSPKVYNNTLNTMASSSKGNIALNHDKIVFHKQPDKYDKDTRGLFRSDYFAAGDQSHRIVNASKVMPKPRVLEYHDDPSSGDGL